MFVGLSDAAPSIPAWQPDSMLLPFPQHERHNAYSEAAPTAARPYRAESRIRLQNMATVRLVSGTHRDGCGERARARGRELHARRLAQCRGRDLRKLCIALERRDAKEREARLRPALRMCKVDGASRKTHETSVPLGEFLFRRAWASRALKDQRLKDRGALISSKKQIAIATSFRHWPERELPGRTLIWFQTKVFLSFGVASHLKSLFIDLAFSHIL